MDSDQGVRTLCDDISLEIFGQQSSAGVQTPFLFLYPLLPESDVDALLQTLSIGLETLSRSFPWVAGNIIDGEGVFKIRSARPLPSIVLKDQREHPSVSPLSVMAGEHFPIKYLDESLLCPLNVLESAEREEDRSQVLSIQLNLIKGGLVLAICGHHQALDGTGMEQVVYLLDKACRGEAFTEEELRVGNMARADIVPLLPDNWEPGEGSPYLPPPSSPTAPKEEEEVELEWTSFSFTPDSLAQLKVEASLHLADGAYISTNDALTALIWQTLSRARLPRLPPSTTCRIGRAINPRPHLGIPSNYPGFISNMAYTTLSLTEVSQRPLSHIASVLRTDLDSNLEHTTREFATLIHRAKDKNTVSLIAKLDLDTDLMLSSWTNLRCPSFDFGLGLGKPVAFRRPKMAPVPSLVFLLPGGNVAMCLRVDDLPRLKEDQHFMRYATVVG